MGGLYQKSTQSYSLTPQASPSELMNMTECFSDKALVGMLYPYIFLVAGPAEHCRGVGNLYIVYVGYLGL